MFVQILLTVVIVENWVHIMFKHVLIFNLSLFPRACSPVITVSCICSVVLTMFTLKINHLMVLSYVSSKVAFHINSLFTVKTLEKAILVSLGKLNIQSAGFSFSWIVFVINRTNNVIQTQSSHNPILKMDDAIFIAPRSLNIQIPK